MLASSINTKLTDILRYAEVRKVNGKTLYTNLEYGLWDVTFEVLPKNDPRFKENKGGKVQICFYDKNGAPLEKTIPLINSDSYSDFKITSFNCDPKEDTNGGYFQITYTIQHTGNEAYSNSIEAVVRIMNE
jgi:hypothetical protein